MLRNRRLEQQINSLHDCLDRRFTTLEGKIDEVREHSNLADICIRGEFSTETKAIRQHQNERFTAIGKALRVLLAATACSLLISVGSSIAQDSDKRLGPALEQIILGEDGLLKLLLSGAASYAAWTLKPKDQDPD
jgi:hypothetical protein